MEKKMKRQLLALLLTICMVLTLFACAKSVAPPAESPSAPPTSGTSVSPSSTPSEAPLSSGVEEIDHFNRDPFKIAYLCYDLSWTWNRTIDDTLKRLGKKLNFEYTSWSGGDLDAYINQIYVFADMGYDGLVLGVDDQLGRRSYEVCMDAGISAFVAESTTFVDENGICIWPSVQQNNYANGALCVEWLAEHYMDYWANPIDMSKLGLLNLDFSMVSGIHERSFAVEEAFKKLFPEAADNYVWGDLTPLGLAGFSVQGGNDLTTSIFASHPEIEHWFVVANVDDWASGATRATETLKMEDRVLVTSVQADAFLKEMESEYAGNVYVAANAVSSIEFSILMAECLVSILEGRETAESIWPEWRDNGGQYPRYQVTGNMITRDTYVDYLAGEQAKSK